MNSDSATSLDSVIWQSKIVPCSRLACTLRLPRGARLGVFKGSLLRGLLGASIKRIACLGSDAPCPACQFAEACIYHRLFEAKQRDSSATLQHQYVICCEDTKAGFSEGDTLVFSVALLADAAGYAAYFIKAILDARACGLTRRRFPFEVEFISTIDGVPVYSHGLLATEGLTGMLRLEPAKAAVPRVTIRFRTPFRTKRDSHLLRAFDPHAFARALFDRAVAVGLLDQGAVVSWRRACFDALLGGLAVENDATQWVDQHRYSNRQRTSMVLGGIQGDVVLSGTAVSQLLPLLRMAEVTHVGKATTFGLGAISVVEGSI